MSFTPVFDATVRMSDPDLYKASVIFPTPSRVPVVREPDPQPAPGFFRLAGMLMKEMVRR